MRAIMKYSGPHQINKQTSRSIGEVVEALRGIYPTLNHSTLRFFEREGLVSPARTAGGHRLYSDADIQRIHDIKRWQQDRLSLSEIQDRLKLRDQYEDLVGLRS